MKKLIKLTIALIFAFVLSGNAQDLNLDEILAKHFETMNTEKLSKAESVQMYGKVMMQGMEFPFSQLITQAGKIRTEAVIQGSKMVRAFDGTDGWMVAPMMGTDEPQDMSPDEVDQMKDQSDLTGKLWNWKDKVQSLELIGKEDMEGTEVYKLKMVEKPKKNKTDTTEVKEGDVSFIYMDAENFVILKTQLKKDIRGTEMEFESYQSNYQDVDGVIFPFSMETKMKGKTVNQISVDSVKFNVPVDDSMFTRPVKAEKKEDGKK